MHFEKKLRYQKVHAARVRDILVVRFPNCFAPRGEAKKPLKLGIGFDVLLALPELNSYSIGAALEDYCSGRTYCESMVVGAARYALDGSEAGFVSALEADHATKRLEAFAREAETNKAAAE
jgi:sRNA-binding protein